MLKRKKTPFFVALNSLDLDLKNLVKFNIREQSLEILPFSLGDNNSLKIFYIDNQVMLLHKGKTILLENPDVNLGYYDDYSDNYNRLLSQHKKDSYNKQTKKENTLLDVGNGVLKSYRKSRESIEYLLHKLTEEEDLIFNDLADANICSRNMKTSLVFNCQNKNFKFILSSQKIKNKLSLQDFYSLVNNSQLSYNNTNFKTTRYDEINIDSIISYHKDISNKIKEIVREFITYKIVKSMPKKYFNL